MIGDRVVTCNGEVGYIDQIDPDGMVGVRVLTPHNTPSCCVTWCNADELSDGTGVVPQPRSKAWYAEARAFMAQVESALNAPALTQGHGAGGADADA